MTALPGGLPTGSLPDAAFEVFHTGFVVSDIERDMADLSRLLGVRWTPIEDRTMVLKGPDGPVRPEMRLAYTVEGPHHLEVIQAVPGTLWALQPVGVGGIIAPHHIGAWCDDVPAASAALAASGSPMLATYDSGQDGASGFAYHRLPGGVLLEICASSRRPGFEAWFAGGPFPVGN
ncbi:VOC family protein [Nakamurella sp. YIM 132087]|uniref:VOC family protein n=1 Tax=Nakamurella alba TaxID=2665158 RepID=A0A7K1FIF3_9ACTN|nr:VOC family protein [Nakamurella alba]MTD13878.1 VOC family protein [Nakamurella alba]